MHPFGCGTPIAATTPPTGPAGFSRYINGASGDYEQDLVTGHLKSMSGVRQRVLLAILTVAGSSSVLPLWGLSRPKKITPSLTYSLKAEVRVALRRMTTTERVLRIDAISVEQTASGRVALGVSYTDLTTGLPGVVSHTV
jgi:phage baseplate assembly protein W